MTPSWQRSSGLGNEKCGVAAFCDNWQQWPWSRVQPSGSKLLPGVVPLSHPCHIIFISGVSFFSHNSKCLL